MRLRYLLLFTSFFFVASHGALAETHTYDFESFTAAFEELTGKPFQIDNTEGTVMKRFHYSGSFSAISNRANNLIKKYNLSELPETHLKAAEAGAKRVMNGETILKDFLVYQISPGMYLYVFMTETHDQTELSISEMNAKVIFDMFNKKKE